MRFSEQGVTETAKMGTDMYMEDFFQALVVLERVIEKSKPRAGQNSI